MRKQYKGKLTEYKRNYQHGIKIERYFAQILTTVQNMIIGYSQFSV